MSTPGDRFRSTLGVRRGRGDETLYARAIPEEVKLTESYSVVQEISRNRSIQLEDAGTGRIKMTLPFDGRDHLTRQAADDVERGTSLHPGTGEFSPVVGHLLLADHEKTDLRTLMKLHNQVGVIPLTIAVGSSDESLEQLAEDRLTCVVEHEYRHEEPSINPIELEIGLYDPDNLDLLEVGMLTWLEVTNPGELVKRLRREASFKSELLLSITARITLPVKAGYPPLYPTIRSVSVDWPTITSLRTTHLKVSQRADNGNNAELRQVPVRYNPDERRLEWQDIEVCQPKESRNDADAGVRIYLSEMMVLNIGHPGELFKKENLTVHAEVEIPNYLLSGLEARLFGATGQRQSPQPKLITRLSVTTELYPADVFEGRPFSPYQQFVFDDIIPDEMRVIDIVAVLRNSKFEVYQQWPDPQNAANPMTPRWLLMARRSQGPEQLHLLIAVDGRRDVMDREQIMADSMVKLSGNKESGQITVSVLGMLPRNHQELTREMNSLQQALRDRFQFQQTSRR